MNIKYGITILVVAGVVVVGSYAYLYRGVGSAKQLKVDVPIVNTVVIEVNEMGFSPDAITVQKNTEVVFRNVGDEAHWPASNLHPTHLTYPEFDPLRAIPEGESWSFVFNKVGNWRMHDHLVPRNHGTITVTE